MKTPIGLLGGTFDPIHLGHLHLAATIYKSCNLQRVIFIPCYQSPLRALPVASAQDRITMIRRAIKNLPFLQVETYETKHATTSYTVKTLEYLRHKNATTPLALIMGNDIFNRFDQWYEWQKILNLAHLVVAKRHDTSTLLNKQVMALVAKRQIFDPQELQKKLAGLIYYVDIEPLPISATEIRDLIKQQKDASHLVTPEVWHYINSNMIYNRV